MQCSDRAVRPLYLQLFHTKYASPCRLQPSRGPLLYPSHGVVWLGGLFAPWQSEEWPILIAYHHLTLIKDHLHFCSCHPSVSCSTPVQFVVRTGRIPTPPVSSYGLPWHRYPSLSFIGIPHSIIPFPLFEFQVPPLVFVVPIHCHPWMRHEQSHHFREAPSSPTSPSSPADPCGSMASRLTSWQHILRAPPQSHCLPSTSGWLTAPLHRQHHHCRHHRRRRPPHDSATRTTSVPSSGRTRGTSSAAPVSSMRLADSAWSLSFASVRRYTTTPAPQDPPSRGARTRTGSGNTGWSTCARGCGRWKSLRVPLHKRGATRRIKGAQESRQPVAPRRGHRHHLCSPESRNSTEWRTGPRSNDHGSAPSSGML